MDALGSSTNRTIVLPGQAHGWTPAGAERTHTREDLFDYIDGGAELYLSYGFRSSRSRTYSRVDQPDIVVDIFEMESARGAIGVFLHTREVADETFGQGSQYVEGMLLFWKDRYYVSILASPETAESKEAVFALARAIDESIPSVGKKPEILGRLPQAGLVEESIRYFHHHVWLNSHCFIADHNLFQIDETTDAVLARYGPPGAQRILLLVRYPDAEHAGRAEGEFLTRYLPDGGRGRAARIEHGTWSGCDRNGTLLAVVFGARQASGVTDLLAAVGRHEQE